jgi:hypothetical protein
VGVQLQDSVGKAKAAASGKNAWKLGGKEVHDSAVQVNRQLLAAQCAADVLQLFEVKGNSFNHVNFATALHRLGTLHDSSDYAAATGLTALIHGATGSVLRNAVDWEARGLANAVWGIAKVGSVEASILFQAVLPSVLWKPTGLKPESDALRRGHARGLCI